MKKIVFANHRVNEREIASTFSIWFGSSHFNQSFGRTMRGFCVMIMRRRTHRFLYATFWSNMQQIPCIVFIRHGIMWFFLVSKIQITTTRKAFWFDWFHKRKFDEETKGHIFKNLKSATKSMLVAGTCV